jgi:hypothetical protein
MKFIAQSIESRLLESAPEQGSGLHRWLIKGARECERSRVSPNRAFSLIAQTVTAKGGEIVAKEINKAITKAYSQPFNNSGSYERKDAWPKPDLEMIEEVTMDYIWSVPSVLSDLVHRVKSK